MSDDFNIFKDFIQQCKNLEIETRLAETCSLAEAILFLANVMIIKYYVDTVYTINMRMQSFRDI